MRHTSQTVQRDRQESWSLTWHMPLTDAVCLTPDFEEVVRLFIYVPWPHRRVRLAGAIRTCAIIGRNGLDCCSSSPISQLYYMAKITFISWALWLLPRGILQLVAPVPMSMQSGIKDPHAALGAKYANLPIWSTAVSLQGALLCCTVPPAPTLTSSLIKSERFLSYVLKKLKIYNVA